MAVSSAPQIFMKDKEFVMFCQAGTLREYDAGEVIFRKGDVSQEMFFILSGSVNLLFEGDRDDKTVGEGDYFGELSFVVGRFARSATAIAATPVRMSALDQAVVDRLLDSHPQLLFSLIRQSCAYLLQSEQELTEDLRRRNLELQKTLDYLRHTKAELDFKELLAQTDELTGLYNRRALNEQLSKFIDRARQSQRRLGVIMIDLDGFKHINDTYGHQSGDIVLKQVAAILKASVRQDDFPCRQGGDEFVLLLPDVTENHGRKLAEKLRTAVENMPPVPADAVHKVSGSLGGAMLKPEEDAEAFLHRADQYLYRAKESGRNLVVWEDQAL